MQGTPLPNVFANLRRDSTSSVVASGVLPDLNRSIYVEDFVDSTLASWIKDPGAIRLFILTGSAGHGKSAAIARACETAKLNNRVLRIRFDATHSNSPKTTYRADLETFLAPFADGKPPVEECHLLAMNLGLALDFFSGDPTALGRWSGLAGLLDDRFHLGLDVHGPRRTDVEVIDLTDRFELDFKMEMPSLPFLTQLLDKLSASNSSSPVAHAITSECSSCPRKASCPVRLNAELLSNPTLQHNLVHAVLASAVKGNVHLTPRNVLDLVSQLVLPDSLIKHLGQSDAECSLKSIPESELGMSDEWGKKLSLTLFEQAFPHKGDGVFPPSTSSSASSNRLLRALVLEDPAAIRSSEWDDQILLWVADPSSLLNQLPPDLVTYLGPLGSSFGKNGYATLIRARRWTSEEPGERRDTLRLNTFVGLCVLDDNLVHQWDGILARALQRAASGGSPDQSARRGRRPKIALNISESASRYEVLADLEDLVVDITSMPHGRSANHASFAMIVRPRTREREQGVPIPVDWATFDLLADVYEGYFPSTVGGPHHLFLRRLRSRLIQASSMSDSVLVRERGVPGEVGLEAKGAGPRLKIEVEVKR